VRNDNDLLGTVFEEMGTYFKLNVFFLSLFFLFFIK